MKSLILFMALVALAIWRIDCKPIPDTVISSGFDDSILKSVQKNSRFGEVDGSVEVGGANGSTEIEKSLETSDEKPRHHQKNKKKTFHVGADTEPHVSGREHIHDPEHGDVEIDEKNAPPKNTWSHVMTVDSDVEMGGNSQDPDPQEFKKGWAPTEIVWSEPRMGSNGYNGGVRRLDGHAPYKGRH